LAHANRKLNLLFEIDLPTKDLAQLQSYALIKKMASIHNEIVPNKKGTRSVDINQPLEVWNSISLFRKLNPYTNNSTKHSYNEENWLPQATKTLQNR
jgi:hypothetical protein